MQFKMFFFSVRVCEKKNLSHASELKREEKKKCEISKSEAMSHHLQVHSTLNREHRNGMSEFRNIFRQVSSSLSSFVFAFFFLFTKSSFQTFDNSIAMHHIQIKRRYFSLLPIQPTHSHPLENKPSLHAI